ncbi:MAG: glycosyltransferase family 2 protein [bacterium]|nr:glycosyltransferase family 2 protein [bacterium]
MKKVSVVMLSYNRCADVIEGVGELLSRDYTNLEILVVDNGSADDTTQVVKKTFPQPQVKLIALENNIGIAAYNIGFNQAQGEYIVILDDDSFPGKRAITRMVEEFEKNPELGVVAFDVRHYDEYNKNESAEETHRENTTCRYQLAFNGCGVGVRKSVIQEVGGYPEEFFLYWNEQDLSIRVLNAGYKIQWFTDIISYHKYSPTNRESLRGPFYYTRNLYWLIWKYFPVKKLLKDTLRMFFYSFYYTFEQRTSVYLKATLTALFNIKKIKRNPAKKEIIDQLRLTYKLAFIYYK